MNRLYVPASSNIKNKKIRVWSRTHGFEPWWSITCWATRADFWSSFLWVRFIRIMKNNYTHWSLWGVKYFQNSGVYIIKVKDSQFELYEQTQPIWVQIPIPLLSSSMICARQLRLFGHWFYHLWNGDCGVGRSKWNNADQIFGIALMLEKLVAINKCIKWWFHRLWILGPVQIQTPG